MPYSNALAMTETASVKSGASSTKNFPRRRAMCRRTTRTLKSTLKKVKRVCSANYGCLSRRVNSLHTITKPIVKPSLMRGGFCLPDHILKFSYAVLRLATRRNKRPASKPSAFIVSQKSPPRIFHICHCPKLPDGVHCQNRRAHIHRRNCGQPGKRGTDRRATRDIIPVYKLLIRNARPLTGFHKIGGAQRSRDRKSVV